MTPLPRLMPTVVLLVKENLQDRAASAPQLRNAEWSLFWWDSQWLSQELDEKQVLLTSSFNVKFDSAIKKKNLPFTALFSKNSF